MDSTSIIKATLEDFACIDGFLYSYLSFGDDKFVIEEKIQYTGLEKTTYLKAGIYTVQNIQPKFITEGFMVEAYDQCEADINPYIKMMREYESDLLIGQQIECKSGKIKVCDCCIAMFKLKNLLEDHKKFRLYVKRHFVPQIK